MSAGWDLWSAARVDGAPSLRLYHRALDVASLIDRAFAALDELDAGLGRVAATPSGSTAAPGDVLGSLDLARLATGSFAASIDDLAAMRRSILLVPDVTAPPPLTEGLRALARDLHSLAGFYGPHSHPLLGTLHGMPDVGLDQLVREEPLFTEGLLRGAGVERSLDQLRCDGALVATTLAGAWASMSGPSPRERARTAARGLRARSNPRGAARARRR